MAKTQIRTRRSAKRSAEVSPKAPDGKQRKIGASRSSSGSAPAVHPVQAIRMLTFGERGLGAAGRARLMRAMQGTVGNNRLSRLGEEQVATQSAGPGGDAPGRERASGSAPAAAWTTASEGRALAPAARRTVEPLVGASLGGVRTHGGREGDAVASSYGADAATSGRHIALGRKVAGFDQPEGRFALAHELAHVAQQSRGHAGALRGAGGGPAAKRAELEDQANEVGYRASGLRPAAAGRPAASRLAGAQGGAPIQLGWFSKLKKGIKKVGKAIGGTAKSVGRGIASVGRKFGGALGKAWNKAKGFLGSAASWAWKGLRSLGKGAWSWLSKAGSAVWRAVRWFGQKAWSGIKWLGPFLWEKLSHLGELAWSFVSNLPKRLWRLAVHGWHGIVGLSRWAWSGLKGAAGWAWGAVKGVFSWLRSGVAGALGWLRDGVLRGARWAWDFIRDPSLGKLWQGLIGTFSWLGRGARGLVRWGWRGIVAAAQWAWRGIRGVAGWLWQGLVAGAEWAGRQLIYWYELLAGGELLQLMWGLIFRMRKLTAAEIAASQEVHPPGMIPYSLVRVDENSVLTWINGGAAVTTMHVLHYPKGGLKLPVVVHELTHVAQYEHTGAVYMAEALHAQAGAGYAYGDLAAARAAGKRFADFNREQQGQMCEDYYLALHKLPTEEGGTLANLQPFIDDMRRGEL